MTKRKTSIKEPTPDTVIKSNVLYVPQLMVPFEITQYGDVSIVPKQVDEGLFRIRTPNTFSINVGKTTVLKTKLKLSLPRFVDVAKFNGVRIDDEVTSFPRAVLHCHIASIHDLLVSKGLLVLSPQVLSANEMNGQELSLCIQNVGSCMLTMNAGEEIASMYFTITPLSSLKLIIEQDF